MSSSHMTLPPVSAGMTPAPGSRAVNPLSMVSAFGARLVGRAIGCIGRMIYERQVRQAVRELNRLDDFMLRDIGVSRSELERVVRYGRPADASVRPIFSLDHRLDG